METCSKKILVSSCLLGLDTRYNGVCKQNHDVLAFITEGEWTAIPVCPEQLAGLPTPRPATCFARGDGTDVLDGSGIVINEKQENMNALFIKGAEQCLKIAELNNCRLAILKERSPSCGIHEIYHGNDIVAGNGVTSALLKRAGLSIFNENELSFISEAQQQEKH